ncbi:MAG: DUF3187 family protein [Cytophagales bacterium]|nr:DUF3187 family protein [Armatimonadota bacterium]
MAPVPAPPSPLPPAPPAAAAKSSRRPLFFGPLPLRLRAGASGVVFMPDPESGAVQPRGDALLSLAADAGNASYELFTDDRLNIVREDNEVQSVRLTYRQGLGGGWEGAVTGSLLSRNGGGLDNLIAWWHRHILGYRDPFREGNAQNTAFFQFAQEGQAVINLPNANATTGLLVFQAKRQIVARTETRRPLLVAVRGSLKLPLRSQAKSQYLDNGATDVLAGISASYRPGGRVFLHTDFCGLYAGTGNVLALRGGRRLLPQVILAGEYALSDRTSLVVQYEEAMYPFSPRLPNHPDRRRQTSFGVWHDASPDTRIFASFSENIAGFQVTSQAPDFQVSAGVQQRL